MVMELKENYFYSDGWKIRYVDVGNGEPVILIHGLGECIESWKFQIPELSKYFRVVALDLRGFGKSEIPDEIDIGDFVMDVKNLMDHLDLKKANLIGFSMGGVICLAFYEKYPRHVNSMVLADTISHLPPTLLKKTLETRLKILNESGMDKISEYIADISFHTGNPELVEFFKDMIRRNDKEYYTKVTVAFLNSDYRHVLPKIKVPTLVLVGEYDVTTPPRLTEYLVNKIPKSTLRIIDNSAHLTKMENPHEFNKYVLEFLQNLKVVASV